MSGYTPTGPFTNGSSPGVSATYLNNIENWIQQLEGDSGSVVLNGSTSGTATLYQVLQGTFKLIFVQLSNFRNGGGSAQTIVLPTAFTNSFWGWTGQSTNFSLVKATVTQTVQQIITLNTGADNGVSGQTVIKQNWLFQGGPGFDTISFTASYPSAGSGSIIIAGI